MPQQHGYFPQVIVPTGGTQQPSPAPASPSAPPHIHSGPSSNPWRVLPVGASLEQLITPYGFTSWQREARRKGEASIYSTQISSQRPVQFPMLTFEVPKSMGLFVNMIDFKAFTFSGIAAGETVEVDPGNLSTKLAFNLEYGGNRPFNSEVEISPLLLAPSDSQTQRASLRTEYYLNSAISGESAASGIQKGLLPFDFMRPGSDVGPLNLYVNSQNNQFKVSAFIFQSFEIPISYFQVKIAGYLTSQTAAEEILGRMKALLCRAPSSPHLPDATGTEIPGAPLREGW